MGNTATTAATAAAKVAQMISATVVMDNSTATARKYAVQANVTVSGSAVSSVDSGTVRDLTGDTHLADFNAYSPASGQLSINFAESYGAAEAPKRVEIMAEIENFMAAAADAAGSILNVEF